IVRVCVSLCWICSLFFVSVLMKNSLKQPECVTICKTVDKIIGFVLVFLIPTTVIVVLYMRVFVVAVIQARAMRSHIVVVSHMHHVKIMAKKSEIKAARTLGVVIVGFLICVCPYFSATITGQDTLFNASSASVIICLYYFNSCLNPIVYALFYPWFRKSIRLIVTLHILKPRSCDTSVL
uniref:G-protein coupled receptors family 1 profile domain-containing protein n=1 Tax=Anabas testudineus TaxID=64144 RepID=A0A3Q1J8L7_ANATE